MLRDDLRITNGFENAVVKKVAFVFASAHSSQLAALRPTSPQQRVNSMLNHKRNTVTTRFSSGHRTAGFAKASGWTPAASDGVEAGGAGCRSGPLRKCKLPRPRWQPKGGGDPSTGASPPGGRRSAGSKREASAGPLMSAAVASPPSSAIESAGAVEVAEMGQGFEKTEEDPYGTVGIVHEGIMKQAVRDVRDERAAADHNETLLGARHSERSMAGRKLTNKLRRLGSVGQWGEALCTLRYAQQLADEEEELGKTDTPGVAVVGTVIYNATLAALSKCGRWREALSLLAEMQTRGVERDTITFSSAISACGRGNQWAKALELLAQMRKENVEINSIVYCNAITACAKGKQWRIARTLLNEMSSVDHLPPHQRCYNAAMDACARAGKQQEAMSLLLEMREVGVPRTSISYLAVISACSRVGDWRRALGLLVLMSQDMVEPDIKCYSAAIAACGNGQQWDAALRVLRNMQAAGITPNEFCYNAAISACGKTGQFQLAIDLLREMESGTMGVWPDIVTYNAIIDACGKSGRWKLALDVLHKLLIQAGKPRRAPGGSKVSLAPKPDATTYASAITACKAGKQWELALMLLEDMQVQGVAPTQDVFQAAIACCSSVGRWRETLNTMENMRISGHDPEVQSYNALITACGRAKQWQLALMVLQLMPSKSVEPDLISYNAALAALEKSGQWQLARQLLESMLDSPQSVKGLDTAAKDDRRGRKTKKDGTYMGLSSDVVRQLRLFVGGAEEAGSGAILGETAALTAAGMKIPRPDGISFHVVLKALLNAGRWTDAMEVLTKMNDEQKRVVEERNEAKGKPHEAALAQPWRLDMTRFRHMFGSAFPAPIQEQDVIVMNAIKSLASEMLDDHEKSGSLLSGNVQGVSRDADQDGLDGEDDTHKRLFSNLRLKPDEDP